MNNIRFENDTIFTIGYEGQNIKQFIRTLQRNKIELVIDVRDSNRSIRKPEFAGNFLRDRLLEKKIKYEYRKDLGVVYQIREAYINGGLSQPCLNEWYTWNVTQREGDKLPELIEHIKTSGRTALLCYEKNVQTCHRDILAKLIMKKGAFEKRRDI